MAPLSVVRRDDEDKSQSRSSTVKPTENSLTSSSSASPSPSTSSLSSSTSASTSRASQSSTSTSTTPIESSSLSPSAPTKSTSPTTSSLSSSTSKETTSDSSVNHSSSLKPTSSSTSAHSSQPKPISSSSVSRPAGPSSPSGSATFAPGATPHASSSSAATSSGDGDGDGDSPTIVTASRSLQTTTGTTVSTTRNSDTAEPTTTGPDSVASSSGAASTSSTSTGSGTNQFLPSPGPSSTSGSSSVTGTDTATTTDSSSATNSATDASRTVPSTSGSDDFASTSESGSLSLSGSQTTAQSSLSVSTSGSFIFTFSDSGSFTTSVSQTDSQSGSNSLPLSTTPSDTPAPTQPPTIDDGGSTHTIVQGGQITTYIVTTITTTVDGEVQTLTRTVPIGVNAAPPVSEADNSGRARAIIGGAVGGAVVLLALGLLGFFLWRRQKYHQATAHRRLAGAPSNMEQRDLDQFDLAAGAAVGQRYRDPSDPFADDDDSLTAPRPGPLMRPRASGTGSIFHETGIWPPPRSGSQLQDPLLSGSEVELGAIVDNVMGSRTTSSPVATEAQRLRGGRTSDDATDPFSPETSGANIARAHARSSTGGSLDGVNTPLLANPRHQARYSDASGTPVRSRLALVTPDTVDQESSSSKARNEARNSSSGPAVLPVGQLVDVDVGDEAPMPSELPPQYHTIRRDSAQSTESAYSVQAGEAGSTLGRAW